MNSKLLLEIKERIEFMRCIEVFVIFAMGTLDFSVVPGRKRFNELVPNSFNFSPNRWGLAPSETNFFVNSAPLSVWMHWILNGAALIRCSTKVAEEYELCSRNAYRYRQRENSSMAVYW